MNAQHLSAKPHSRLTLRGYVGNVAVSQSRKLLDLMAVAVAVVGAAVRPATWRRTVRAALVRQTMSCGVEAAGIVCFLAIALGILLVTQYQVWVGNLLQSRLLAQVLVVVVVRELGPLLVNLVLIARSGSAITVELGLMQVSGETRLIEGQGLELLNYVILPRVLGMIISALCLTIFFTAVCAIGVYLCGQWVGAKTGTFLDFVQNALNSIVPRDVVNLFLKSTLPPLLYASVSCTVGLGDLQTVSQVPRASRLATQQSLVILFIITAAISVGTYL